MRVIQITSPHDGAEAVSWLALDGPEALGACAFEGPAPHHLLVHDDAAAIRTLREHGIAAIEVSPPLPVTPAGVRWWSAWRSSLPLKTYVEFRSLHHDKVKSRGALIRVRNDERLTVEPWRILADAGIDVRCEYYCPLPTGSEIHILVPEPEASLAALERAGVAACAMDYAGPTPDHGIRWWGEWKPALTYASRVQRPLLLSFASPRVEHVPGVW
jgi:hypothetical protein